MNLGSIQKFVLHSPKGLQRVPWSTTTKGRRSSLSSWMSCLVSVYPNHDVVTHTLTSLQGPARRVHRKIFSSQSFTTVREGGTSSRKGRAKRFRRKNLPLLAEGWFREAPLLLAVSHWVLILWVSFPAYQMKVNSFSIKVNII